MLCPDCGYANDTSCSFCQSCGNRRGVVADAHRLRALEMAAAGRKLIPVDEAYVGQRLIEMDMCFRDAANYRKALTAVELEVSDYLVMKRGVSLATASPLDVLSYLVCKDLGKKVSTVVHMRACPELGARTRTACKCPLRMNHASLDSLIGRVRRVFNDAGRTTDWVPESATGNPCASRPVKEYLRAVKREQSMAGVTPNQAVPFFRDKLVQLVLHINQELRKERSRLRGEESTLSLTLVRDRAFFCLDLHTCKRGGDLGKLLIPQIVRLPDGSGLMFNMTVSKTLRGGSTHSFGCKKSQDNMLVCPVSNLEGMVATFKAAGLNMAAGYLFRQCSSKRACTSFGFGQAHLQSAEISRNLKAYLQAAGIDDGESLSSFRPGGGIELAMVGCTMFDIMEVADWKSARIANHYLKLREVLGKDSPAERLARLGGSAQSKAGREAYRKANSLRAASVAFK